MRLESLAESSGDMAREYDDLRCEHDLCLALGHLRRRQFQNVEVLFISFIFRSPLPSYHRRRHAKRPPSPVYRLRYPSVEIEQAEQPTPVDLTYKLTPFFQSHTLLHSSYASTSLETLDDSLSAFTSTSHYSFAINPSFFFCCSFCFGYHKDADEIFKVRYNDTSDAALSFACSP
jgi:hypothetical protein